MTSSSRSIAMLRDRLASERGFSMIPALIAVFVGSLLSLGAWMAAHTDVNAQNTDRWGKVAYTAAQSGVTDYVQRLSTDSSFWSRCDQPPTGVESAINDTNPSPRKWLPAPTSMSAEDEALTNQYTIDLIPANNYTSCKATSNRALTMIDQTTGTFRVRVTGRAGAPVPATATINPDPANPSNFVARTAASISEWRQKRWTRRSIVLEFRNRGFLDFAYFTDREGMDPDLISGLSATGKDQCSRYYVTIGTATGRYNYSSCTEIRFANGDQIKGPFHTNDSVLVESFGTGGVVFGNTGKNDSIEVSDDQCPFRTSGNEKINPSSCLSTWKPQASNIRGTLLTGDNAPVLPLPDSNEDLKIYGDPTNPDPDAVGETFSGPTRLVMNSNGTITVTNALKNGGASYSINYPPSGVIYVENLPGCTDLVPSGQYSFSDTTPMQPATCGRTEVQGIYTQPLTITSESDIVVTGNVTRLTTNDFAVLGLIANKYVRVRNYAQSNTSTCGNRGIVTTGNSAVTTIEAAILTLQHSFIVDRYNCGSSLGTLRVYGALAQKFRGAVGQSGGASGYLKDYEYDYRYRYMTPPHFLSPTLSTWKVSRFREQHPACACTG